MLGYDLMQNFRLPYLATSISEFWQRWHISLSTWFRDYVSFPLRGNRVSQDRWFFNIGAVFILSGFWHGAYWTFLIWGGLHATYYLFESFRAPASKLMDLLACPGWLRRILAMVITFHLVLIGWVFFRAERLFLTPS